MSTPRKGKWVVGLLLAIILLGFVAIGISSDTRVWEWLTYSEWRPIFKASRGNVDVIKELGPASVGDSVLKLVPDMQVFGGAQPTDKGSLAFFKLAFFKAKKRRISWLPGKDVIILQIDKDEFQRLFPKEWHQVRQYEVAN